MGMSLTTSAVHREMITLTGSEVNIMATGRQTDGIQARCSAQLFGIEQRKGTVAEGNPSASNSEPPMIFCSLPAPGIDLVMIKLHPTLIVD